MFYSDAILKGKIEADMFRCMAYNSQGIIAGGNDHYFRQIIINNNGVAIEKVIIFRFYEKYLTTFWVPLFLIFDFFNSSELSERALLA